MQSINLSQNSTTFVRANGVSSSLDNFLNTSFIWDFGNLTESYNQLNGYNAQHMYSQPGTYPLTFTTVDALGNPTTITQVLNVSQVTRKKYYISSSGNNSNDGLSPATPWKTLDKLRTTGFLNQSNLEILCNCGDTFNLSVSLPYVNGSNVRFGSYGTGNQPTWMWTGTTGNPTIINTGGSANGVIFEGITFDSIVAPIGTIADKLTVPYPVGFGGKGVVVKNCTFLNIYLAVTTDSNASGLLVQDCSAPSATGLRGGFLWLACSDVQIIGCYVNNVTREYGIRGNGVHKINVQQNTILNLDRSNVDPQDMAKGALFMNSGSYFYYAKNTLKGASAVELGNRQSKSYYPTGVIMDQDKARIISERTDYAVVENNTFLAGVISEDSHVEVHPNLHHVLIQNNLADHRGRDGVGYIVVAQDELIKEVNSEDITIKNNTFWADTNNPQFLTYENGLTTRHNDTVAQYTVTNNLFTDVNLKIGYASSAGFWVNDSDLIAFKNINNNIYPIPIAINTNYTDVNAINTITLAGSTTATKWFSLTEWNNLLQVGDDKQGNAPFNSGNYTATINGITAGANLART